MTDYALLHRYHAAKVAQKTYIVRLLVEGFHPRLIELCYALLLPTLAKRDLNDDVFDSAFYILVLGILTCDSAAQVAAMDVLKSLCGCDTLDNQQFFVELNRLREFANNVSHCRHKEWATDEQMQRMFAAVRGM